MTQESGPFPNPVAAKETSVAASPDTTWISRIRSALAGHDYDYTSGSLTRAVFLLAIPMVLEMMMESVFAVCDVFFVSRLGDDAVAVVGLTEAMLTIVYALAIGLAMGATAMVARRIGEKNIDGATRAAAGSIALGVFAGVVIGLPCAFFAPTLLKWMGASDAVVAIGGPYASILLGCNIVITLLFLNNAVFRGAGDAAVAMRVLWLANGINLVLDPCLIFGLGPFPELGVTGAAIATTIGRGSGVLYQFYLLRRGTSRIALRGPACRVERRVVMELLRLSSGGVMQFLIATASWVALMRIVAPFGDAVVAGYTIAVRIVMFAILPAWGLANAAATLVGQNLGAGQPDRAERAVWITGAWNMAFMGLVTVAFLLGSDRLIGLFTTAPETARIGVLALQILSAGYMFYAWGMVMVQAFNGAGDTMTPTRLNLVCFWCLQIPMAYLLAVTLDIGPSGVFWSVAICEAILAVLSIVMFRRGRWKEMKIAADGH